MRYVIRLLLEDVLQAGRERHTVRHRERESMRLSGSMIRVLSQNDHLHLVERRQVKSIENQRSRRVNGILPLLTHEKRLELGEIRCLKLGTQHLVPTFINSRFLHFHFHKFSAKMIIFRRKIRYFAYQIQRNEKNRHHLVNRTCVGTHPFVMQIIDRMRRLWRDQQVSN